MNAQNVPVVKVNGPAQMLSLIPQLIGKQPEQGIDTVMVVLRKHENGKLRVEFAARMDTDDLDLAAAACLSEAARHKGEAALIVVYGDQLTDGTDHLAALIQTAGLRLVDYVRVDHSTWWSAICGDPTCCPPDGVTIQPLPNVEQAKMNAFTGIEHPLTRAEQAARFIPLDTGATVQPFDTLPEALSALQAWGSDPLTHDPVLAGRALVTGVLARDKAITMDVDAEHWLEVARVVEGPARDTAYIVAAIAFHVEGHGMGCNECLGYVKSNGPNATLRAQVSTAYLAAMNPSVVREIMRVEAKAVVEAAIAKAMA